MLATTSSATTIFSLNRIDTIKRNVHVSHDKGLGTAPLKAYKCFTTNQNTQILQLWLERNIYNDYPLLEIKVSLFYTMPTSNTNITQDTRYFHDSFTQQKLEYITR